MQKIKEWLSGKQNFIIGRAIYRAMISADDELIQLLDQGYSQYTHQKLVNAMQAHLEPPAAITKPKNEGKVFLKYWVAGTDQELDSPSVELTPIQIPKQAIDPFVVKALEKEWQIPYKKMQYLIAQIDQFGEANDPAAIASRMDLAGQILELEQQVNSVWAKKDEYEKTGHLAAAVDDLEIPTDPIQLAELINRIKKGIRNNKTRMQKFPDKATYAEKYQTYKMQYFKVTGKHYQDKV